MTRAEKFKEVFGVDADVSHCTFACTCKDCLIKESMPDCYQNWWHEEINESKSELDKTKVNYALMQIADLLLRKVTQAYTEEGSILVDIAHYGLDAFTK